MYVHRIFFSSASCCSTLKHSTGFSAMKHIYILGRFYILSLRFLTNVYAGFRFKKNPSFSYVIGSSSIKTSQITNFAICFYFFHCAASAENNNKNSVFKIGHVQIDELPRTIDYLQIPTYY